MELPKIKNMTPYMEPIGDGYPDLFIIEMQIHPLSGDTQPIDVVYRPYNQKNAEVYPNESQDQRLHKDNIYYEAYRCPAVVQALGNLIVTLDLLQQESHLITSIDSLDAGKDKSAASEALAVIQKSLGIGA